MTSHHATWPGERARAVADAVLHEGYVLYPYRASAPKNQARWQFGVLTPPAWGRIDPAEPGFNQTECLLVAREGARVDVRVRFLHVESRIVEEWTGAGFRPVRSLTVADEELVTWDEGIDQEIAITVAVPDLQNGTHRTPFRLSPSSAVELIESQAGDLLGRVRRERHSLHGEVLVTAEPVDGSTDLRRLRVRTENTTPWDEPGGGRVEAVRRSLVAAHVIMVAAHADFVSLIDPPQWARSAAATCESHRCWPVLIGEPGDHDVVLAGPIILDDYPAVAPESTGDFYDATEIDELLTLRTATLTEAEKREARATDPRAAEVVDRAEAMPADMLAKLHGAVRSLRSATGDVGEPPAWWTPEQEASVAPEAERVVVAGVEVSRGTTVVLRPRRGRADAQDMFLDGRSATVRAVFREVEGEQRHLAVTVDDDPASDLLESDRRYLYFGVDEVEPVRDPTRPGEAQEGGSP